MRKYLLAAALLLFLAGFNFSAMRQEKQVRDGSIMYLELAPVDPRAFMLGDYMDLDYTLNREITEALASLWSANSAPGTLLPKEGLAVVELSARNIATFVRLEDGTPLEPNQRQLFFRVSRGQARAAAPSFFFQEGRAQDYEAARFGEIHVVEDGRSLLTYLLDRYMRRIGKH